jgi:hypothetical protein
MPLDASYAKDLVALIDANDNALAWVKEMSTSPTASENTIPHTQLTTSLLGKNEIVIVYGEKHPMFVAGSDNIALFDTWAELNAFGTNFDATGSRPIPTPVCAAALLVLTPANYPVRSNSGRPLAFGGPLVLL